MHERPTRSKQTGQWALGQRDPLNPNEQFKAEDDGLNVRARIEQIYAKEGFSSIPAEDLRGRMRWWGLYTQRRPGIDGGRTASLPPEELDDEYFMLRIRSDGGMLSLDQLRAIADISTSFGRDTADITDRQNIQLHWIRIEDMPEIWRRLEAVGLSTTEACGDTPRVVLGSPVAGIAQDEIIDGTPAIEEIVRRYVGDPEYSNLPRKFKSAVSGSPRQDVAHEINCMSFVGVVHPEHGPGFDVWVGGGLSTNPMVAQRLGAWVPLDDVPDVWEGIIRIYRDYGYRRLRNRARLKFLMADWGPQKFREVLEQEYLGRPLIDGPPPGAPTGRRDHVGIAAQTDGRFYVGAAPTVGRVSGTVLTGIADLMARHGSSRLRLTAQQKLVILDVAEPEPLADGLEALGLQVRPSEFRRGAMACTGIEFCKLAIVETKARTAALVDTLETQFGEKLDGTELSIHVNGCPNSCARFQIADIGFKGSLVPDADGEMVEGFQVHLGGRLGPDAGFGRKLRALKVTAAEMPDYVHRVLQNFSDERLDTESFADWVQRTNEDSLR
ncbi:MAG: nitrite/sulfite reductase [Actinobacteria bacterium]|nr:nitrite/sulfite reductase [Actinomycetota bacterium]MCB8997126.1 nitrite/sulfite reductase [Actinomycetota bacterium]MCB9415335.1 nitrite/sulfite reductase [Actinomycetota bacterium]HRY11208.1 nitrite/sulfite reductase [Candidatus Nanopelagicales bacterium]